VKAAVLVGVLAGLLGWGLSARALAPEALGVLYRNGDANSAMLAREYAAARGVPLANVVGLDVPRTTDIPAARLTELRSQALARLPAGVDALLLVWSTPYRAGCMSITTAFAAGYDPAFCEPGCQRTRLSPLYDAESLSAARRIGWRPAMLLPSDDAALARDLVRRGRAADGSTPPGIAYLVSTGERDRNVRAAGYADVVHAFSGRLDVRLLPEPPAAVTDPAIAYFTGVAKVAELAHLAFRPGAVADHLTSIGGVLDQTLQTTAVEWLRAGATASYGTVTEPCNHTGKFPNPMVFLSHYLGGESLIEAYWKSVAMPGQGLFVGEPLARPYAHGPVSPGGQGRTWVP
jgi:uncharacterized protein (TIGR03790 family)